MSFWDSLDDAKEPGEKVFDWLTKRFGLQKAGFSSWVRKVLPLFEQSVHLYILTREKKGKFLLIIETCDSAGSQGPTYTALDGLGPTLTSVVERAGGVREGCEAQYLHFFCEQLLATDGNFVVATRNFASDRDPREEFESRRDAMRAQYLRGADGLRESNHPDQERQQADAEVRAEVEALSKPGESHGEALYERLDPEDGDQDTDSRWACVIVHAGTAFKARFKVNRATGTVEMTDDKPIVKIGKTASGPNVRQDKEADVPYYVSATTTAELELHAAMQRLEETGILKDCVVRSSLDLSSLSRKGVRLERVLVEGDVKVRTGHITDLVLKECVLLGRLDARSCHLLGGLTVDNTDVHGLTNLPSPGVWTRLVVNLEAARIEGALTLTRLNCWGSLWAPRIKVGRYADLRGFRVMPAHDEKRASAVPSADSASSGASGVDHEAANKVSLRKILISRHDHFNMVNFEQATIGGDVDLGIHVRDREDALPKGFDLAKKDLAEALRDSVIVGQITFQYARIAGSLSVPGLRIATLKAEYLDTAVSAPIAHFSLMGARIGGSLLCYLSDSDWYASAAAVPPLRCVVGGSLDLTLAELGGALDFRSLVVHGNLNMTALQCRFVSLNALEIAADSELKLMPFDLDELLNVPAPVIRLEGDEELLPVARIHGDIDLHGSQIPAGITAAGAQCLGAITIVGGEIGGLRFKPFVLQKTKNGVSAPEWKPARIGSLRAVDLRFTRRLHFFGTRFSDERSTNPAPLRPRPAFEVHNCFINGGIYFSDPSIYDDDLSFDEKSWAYHWAGYPDRKSLYPSQGDKDLPQSLKVAVDARNRRIDGNASWVDAELDALATCFKGDVEVVNCELDGDFDFTNAAVNGHLRLTDTVVRADVRAAAFSEEAPQPGRWMRVASCTSLELDALSCDGDVDLSGCRLTSVPGGNKQVVSARGSKIAGELRLAREVDNGTVRCLQRTRHLNLTDAKCGRLVLPQHRSISTVSNTWTIDGLKVSAYAVEGTSDEHQTVKAVTRMLDDAEFAPQVYLDYERSLVSSGRTEDADQIFRLLKFRMWGQDKGEWSSWRAAWETFVIKPVYGSLMGFGTRFLRPVLVFLATLAIAMYAVWTPSRVQPSSARLAAAETGDRFAHAQSQCPVNWDFPDQLWLALRYAVPVVSLVDAGDWEPRDAPAPESASCGTMAAWYVAPRDIVFVVAIVNWLLLPTFLLGVTARIQRRRG